MTGGNWIAFASLAGFILVQTATIAFFLGGLFARVKMLEARPHDSDCATHLAALTATLTAFKSETERRMDGIDQAVHSLRTAWMSQQSKPSVRRSAQ